MDKDYRHNDEVIIAELRALKELLMLKVSNTEDELKFLKEQFDKSNERIRVIEIWQSNSMGKIAIIFTIIGIIATAFITWVFKHF